MVQKSIKMDSTHFLLVIRMANIVIEVERERERERGTLNIIFVVTFVNVSTCYLCTVIILKLSF